MLRQKTHSLPASPSGKLRQPLAELSPNRPAGSSPAMPELKVCLTPPRAPGSARGRDRGQQTTSSASSRPSGEAAGVPARRCSWTRPCVTEAVKVLPDASSEGLLARLSAADRDDLLLLAAGVCVVCALVCSATLVCSQLLQSSGSTAGRWVRPASNPLLQSRADELLLLSGGEVRVHLLLQRVVRSLVLAPVRWMRGPLKAVLVVVRWLLRVSEE